MKASMLLALTATDMIVHVLGEVLVLENSEILVLLLLEVSPNRVLHARKDLLL